MTPAPASISSARPNPDRSRRRFWCSFFLILIALVVGFYQVELWWGRASWRTYERDAVRRGVKLDFYDFVPPQIPDAENFASIPLMQAVFDADDSGQAIPKPFALVKDSSARPKLSDLWNQRHPDLDAWQKILIEQGYLPQTGNTPAADILRALGSFAGPLQELRDADMRRHCRFPVHWEKGPAASLPHLGVLQTAAQLYSLRLSAHLANGESPAAYEDFRDGLRLATAIREEPSIISGLVRISIHALMLNCVWDGLAQQQWRPSELEKIEADIAKIDWLADYVFALSSERGAVNGIFGTVIHDPKMLAKTFGQPSTASEYLRPYPAGWVYQSKVRTNRFVDELLARVEPVRRRHFSERPLPSSARNLPTWSAGTRYLLFVLLSSPLETVEAKYLQCASISDEARIACALERFRMTNGSYPSDLAELSPAFIAELPVEVVS